MQHSETHTIIMGGQTVSYVLVRKQVKNINMRIRAESGLSVSASPMVPLSQIEAALRENQGQILKALQQMTQTERPQQYPVQYVTGEPVLYLGKMYALVVENGSTETVVLQDKSKKMVLVTVPGAALAHRKAVFERWWKQRCALMIGNLCRAVYPIYAAQHVSYPREIRYRQMVSQWGNCRPEQGILTFNLRLLAAPPRCMEYVVMHEFTHFLYPNHSQDFYRFIASELPDWKQLEKQLGETVEVRLGKDSSV